MVIYYNKYLREVVFGSKKPGSFSDGLLERLLVAYSIFYWKKVGNEYWEDGGVVEIVLEGNL